MVDVKIVHLGKMQFQGENETGLSVTMDSSLDFGGENAGVKPMELLLISAGGCTGMDVVDVMRKKKQNITGYEINISGKRADDHPKVFTEIKIEHVVRGKGIDPKAMARAVELSTDKYCSVIGMLKQITKLNVTYRIEEG